MTAINFNSIYTTYYRRAFLFTLSYVHNDLVAEDIVSEAIIYFWELSKKQEIPSIEAVLITYIRSKSLNYLKHLQVQENVYQNLTDKGQRELEIRISTLEACDPKEVMSEELRSKVKTLLAGMPEKTRIAFISDRLDGKSHKEIAEELGISVKGVEYHISLSLIHIYKRIMKKSLLYLFMLVCSVSLFSSCGDDDDEVKYPIDTDLAGGYIGKLLSLIHIFWLLRWQE